MLASFIFLTILSTNNALFGPGEISVDADVNGTGCPKSNGNIKWKHFKSRSKCYVQIIGSEFNFADAEIWCRSLGGHIAMPKTIEEIKNVVAMVTAPVCRYVWIGMDDIEEEGRFVWADRNIVTESQKQWEPAAPNNVFGLQHCVQLDTRTDQFDDKHCSSYYIPFLCETTDKNFEKQYEEKRGWCPPDWVHIDCGKFCYWVSDQKLDFESAKENCSEKGGVLAMPKTSREERAVLLMSSSTSQYKSKWEGWIGLQRSGEDKSWSWLDGTPHTTADLVHKKPCVYTRWDGDQASAFCNELRHYICQKPQNSDPAECPAFQRTIVPEKQIDIGVILQPSSPLMVIALGLCQLVNYV